MYVTCPLVQVCVMLGVVFLLVHTSLQPFRRSLLNRLERLSLATIAISFCLLSMGVSVSHQRKVTSVLLLLLNGCTILYFLWLIGRELWRLVGRAVTQNLMTMRSWLTQTTSSLRPGSNRQSSTAGR
jgi:hypothetical protein